MLKVRRRDILCLALVAILLGMLTWGPLNLEQALNMAVLTVLVYVTWRYAQETGVIAKATREQAASTEKLAKEMSEQRYDAVLPIIDIKVQEGGGRDMIKQGLDAKEGRLPKAMPCILRNIGLGPATGVHSLIEDYKGERLWGDLGTLAMEEKTREIRLFLGQDDGRDALVVYYRDTYGRPLESSREVIVDKARASIEIGPLRICKLAEEEWPKFTIAKVEIPPPGPEY